MRLDSIRKTEVEQKLIDLCSPVAEAQGLRLVDADCRMGGRPLLRLYIDKLNGDKGPTLDECAEFSRALDPILENSEICSNSYDLEVSSPGLDRRLRLQSDFISAIGSEINLSLVASEPGLGSKVRAQLVAVEESTLKLRQGVKNIKEFSLSLGQIKSANRIWQFGA